MHTETIGKYTIECSGIQLPHRIEWSAHLGIYTLSENPMHRNCVFPSQRVEVDTLYSTEQEAEAAARQYALAMLEK